MQHGPISGRLIMPRRGKDWPQRGCRGSMTETMGSEHMSSGRGVIGWAGFPTARGARDQDVMTLLHPLAGSETGHHGLVQAAGMSIVDIFDAGRLPEFGLTQTRRQAPGVPFRQRAVDQEPEAFLKAERRDVRHLELLDQCMVHTGQFQSLEFVEGGM